MRSRAPLVIAPLLLALAGCTAAPSPEPAPAPPVNDVEVPDATSTAIAPGEVEPDTTLIITTTATAANGSQLALEMRVHQPIPFDDIANQTLPAAFVQSCGATYNADLFAAGAWSFARANISAVPAAASTVEWPVDAAISVLPSASTVPLVGRGMLREAADSAAPCAESKSFAAAGNGAIAIGSVGDTGTFTAWALQRFGFSAGAGITLTDCTATVTALGSQLSSETSWTPVTDANNCSTGAP